jgi:DMSO reductase family type II enzyme chaperone
MKAVETEMEIVNTKLDEAVSDADLGHCRAALYSALALGFQPPDDEILSRLLTADSRSSLAGAATMLYPEQPDLISAIEALPAAEETNRWALASKYRVFFGHTAQGGISPYETEYGNEALFQQPQELGDLMGFYRAFGLDMRAGIHERPDHVSCEFEFLMFLALKEAYALEHNDRDMRQETCKAEMLFMRDHVGRFLPAFVGQLQRADRSGFYGNLGELCRRFVAAEADRLQVPLGAANLGLRPADDSRIPMACGSGADCAAMPGAAIPEGADSV